MTRRVLVTGANGFIGRHLCRELVARKFRVKGALRTPEAVGLLPPKTEPVVVGDLDGSTDWSDALHDVDIVVHLAGRAHTLGEEHPDHWKLLQSTNVDGTERIAVQAAECHVDRFVFVSSVGAMATMADTILDEESPSAPQTQYGRSKLLAETRLRSVAEDTGLDLLVLRSTLVYGPENAGNFLRLLRLVDMGVPFPSASLHNRRSFVYVGNLVDAIITSMNHPRACSELFLVSDGTQLSTAELIQLMAAGLRRRARFWPLCLPMLRLLSKAIKRGEFAERLVGCLAVDIAKIQRVLGWRPPYSMAEGIAATALWYVTQFGQRPLCDLRQCIRVLRFGSY